MEKVINKSWTEVQAGLYLEERTIIINGVEKVIRTLHSSNGYQFYVVDEELNEDRSRNYYQEMQLGIQQSSWAYEQLNDMYVSVPIVEIEETEKDYE